VGTVLRGSVITLCTPRGRFPVDAGTDCRVGGLATLSVLSVVGFWRRGEDSVDFGDVAEVEALSLLRVNLPYGILSLPRASCISTRLSRKYNKRKIKKPGTTRFVGMADQLSKVTRRGEITGKARKEESECRNVRWRPDTKLVEFLYFASTYGVCGYLRSV